MEDGIVVFVERDDRESVLPSTARWSAAAVFRSSRLQRADRNRCGEPWPIAAAAWGGTRSYARRRVGFLAETSDGGAPSSVALESSFGGESPVQFTRQLAESVQRKAIQYDRDGYTHYDVISALIKSIRGSDPDAGLYWLRGCWKRGRGFWRLVILAEDVGNADPAAAVGRGYGPGLRCRLPECQLSLAQAVTYLACAEVERSDDCIGEARRTREGGSCPCRCIARRSLRGAAARGEGKAISMPDTIRGHRLARLPGDRAGILSSYGPWV